MNFKQKSDLKFKKRKLLIPVGGGGFFQETYYLIKNLTPKINKYYDIYFVVSMPNLLKKDLLKDKNVFLIDTIFYHHIDKNIFLKLYRLVRSFIQMGKIFLKLRPHAVLWIGDIVGLPAAVWGKIFRAKVIFIESVTRVNKPCKVARYLVNLHLADKVYVQWPDMVPVLKNSEYAGWVL